MIYDCKFRGGMSGYRPIGISGYRAFGMSVSPLSEENGRSFTSGSGEPCQNILPICRNHKSPPGFHADAKGRTMPITNMFLRNSRGALTPSNIHRTFSVRLIRFTAKYKEKAAPSRYKRRKGCEFNSQAIKENTEDYKKQTEGYLWG